MNKVDLSIRFTQSDAGVDTHAGERAHHLL
jgi:hypothetical protein